LCHAGEEEAGRQDKKLAEEDVGADPAEDQAGCRLKGESSSLNQFLWTGLLISRFPLFSLTLGAQFSSLTAPISLCRLSWHMLSFFPLNLHLINNNSFSEL
jgi:hypothetical protein